MNFTKVPPQYCWKPPCRIAFVGEAPALDETIEGLPMVGAAGRVNGQLLRTAGLAKPNDLSLIPRDFYPELASRGLRPLLWERSDFHWTNVFNERLPENDVKNWCGTAKEKEEWGEDYSLTRIGTSGYLRPEYLVHLRRLSEELQEARPTLVVPLGATALWAFTGDTEIMASRGAVAKATLIMPGTKLLPTLHPIAVVHQYKMFSVVVADLVKAAREAMYPEIRLPHREIWIEPTLEDLYEFKARWLDKAEVVSVDIETAGGQITCIGFAPSEARALVVPFVDYRKPTRSYWPSEDAELQAWNFVREVLEAPTAKLFQNGPYDIYWLMRYAGIKVNNYLHDTRLMHHALYPELPKSLQFMGASYGQNFAWKGMRERKSEKRDE